MKYRMLKFLVFIVMIGIITVGCSDKDASDRNRFIKAMPQKVILDKTVQRTIMKVEKLTCGSCLAAIGQKLSAFEGIAGMGADLSRGLVGVDHVKTLKSDKIAEAITSIGYPAKVLSITEIDTRQAFSSAGAGGYNGGCGGCGNAANTTDFSGGNEPLLSPQDKGTSSGCPYAGSVRSRGCYANSASWKELIKRFGEKE